MLYVFNEGNTGKWVITDKNDTFLKIGSENGKIGVDIMKNGSGIENYDEKYISSIDNEHVRVASYNSYGCYFNKLNGNPFLHTVENPDEYCLDLFLLAYKVDPSWKICKNKSNKFTILYTYTDVAAGMVYIIGVAKPINNTSLYLTFTDENQTMYVTKHLVTTKNGIINVIIKDYTAEEAKASKYSKSIIGNITNDNIKRSRPTHPYSVIICPADKMDSICEKFHKNKFHTALVSQEDPALYSILKKYQTEGYSAVTFYIDKNFNEINQADMGSNKYTKMFRRINYITKDGKIRS